MALAFRVNGPLWSRPGLVCDGRDDANGWTALGLGGLAYMRTGRLRFALQWSCI